MRSSFLLGGRPLGWLNQGVKPAVYTLGTLPPLAGDRSRYGVLGFPVTHSLSPAMQEAGFRALGLSAEYLRIEIPGGELNRALPLLRAAGFSGWNCTLPHKESMFSLCETTDRAAQEAGSVNTVKVSEGSLHGTNTDADGWEDAVAETWNLDWPACKILLVGCGGVGRTLAFHLVRRGCLSLTLVNRDPKRAERIAEELRKKSTTPVDVTPWNSPLKEKAAKEADLWIQATRLGLSDEDPLPLPEDCFHKGLKIYDTVYRREFTPLIRSAHRQGIEAVDGLGMLLHQGARALAFWTGKKAPLPEMRAALAKAAGRSV